MIKADRLFFTPDFLGKTAITILPEEESMHAIKVLRMQKDDHLHLVNGKGGLFEAKIINPHPKRCEVEILHSTFNYGKRDFHLHIAIAPTKMNERMEWFLEKATEIGIDEITPIICRHSERKELRLARMNKILIAAMKQSVKTYLPQLNEPCLFEKFIQKDNTSIQLIAHCIEGEEKTLLQDIYKEGSNALVMIGPEGDFSTEEVRLALEQGFHPISLGSSRLRTETAGIAACHTICLKNRV